MWLQNWKPSMLWMTWKGFGGQLKKTSNLPIKATNACVDLDVDETNDLFTNVGPEIQEEVELDDRQEL